MNIERQIDLAKKDEDIQYLASIANTLISEWKEITSKALRLEAEKEWALKRLLAADDKNTELECNLNLLCNTVLPEDQRGETDEIGVSLALKAIKDLKQQTPLATAPNQPRWKSFQDEFPPKKSFFWFATKDIGLPRPASLKNGQTVVELTESGEGLEYDGAELKDFMYKWLPMPKPPERRA